MRKTFMLCALLALAVPAAALAQDKPVEVNFGGGVTFPVGDVADSFDTGWNFAAGLTFNVNETVGIQGEYQYFRFEGPDRVFDNAINPGGDRILIESNHQMNVVDFNLVLRAGGTSGVRGYVLAGPGVYWRKVQLTTPSVGVRHGVRPLLAGVLPDGGVGRRDHRRPHGHRLRHERGRRRDLRCLLRRGPLPLRVGQGRHAEVGSVAGQKLSTQASYFPITFGFRF